MSFFFDDDDVVHPDNLKICLEVIEENTVDFCHYQKLSYADEKPTIETKPLIIQQYLTKADIEKIITQKIGLASCTVMWKKYCFDNCRFNENLLYAEEWECYSRLMTLDFKGVVIDNILYYNRKHSNSNTGEFYTHNPVRRASKKNAILLVAQNLKEKQLLSFTLMRYFVQLSLDYKEYDLFKQLLHIQKLTLFQKVEWQLFYFTLPLRLFLFGKWKEIKKRRQE